jgi:hypothetical protein
LKIAIESLKGSNFSKSHPFITKITTSTTLNKPKKKPKKSQIQNTIL